MEKQLWNRSETRQWTITLFLGTLTVYAARVALPICAVKVTHEYHWSKTESGTVLSSFFWGYATTQVLGGWLADKYGGDNVLAVSTLFWSLITLFTPSLFHLAHLTSHPLFFMVVLRVAKGVTQGFHFPCCASLVSRRLTATEKGRVFGIVTAGSHAGTIVCGSVGSLVLDMYGWRSVFHLIGSLGLIWWMYVRYLASYGSSRRRLLSDGGESGYAMLNGSPSYSKKSKGSLDASSPVPWSKLFHHPSFWAAFCAHYCGANAYFTLFSWLPSYFAENYPEAKGWVFNVVPNLALISTALLSPHMASRLIADGNSVTFTRRVMEGASLFGLALCLFGVSAISTFDAALTLFAVGMACRGLHHGGVSVNPQDFAPNHTGAVFGVLNTAGAIPGFVGVYVAGTILEWTHSWSYVFIVTGVQCLFGMLVYINYASGNKII